MLIFRPGTNLDLSFDCWAGTERLRLGISCGTHCRCCGSSERMSPNYARFFLFSPRQFCPLANLALLGYHSTCRRNSLLNFKKVRFSFSLTHSAYKRVHARAAEFSRQLWTRKAAVAASAREKVLVEEFKTRPCPLFVLYLPLWIENEESAATLQLMAGEWAMRPFTWFNNAVKGNNIEISVQKWRQ